MKNVIIVMASACLGLSQGNVCAQDSLNVIKVGEVSLGFSALDVAVDGDYAYIAAGYAGLRILDVSEPSSPMEVGYYDTPGVAEGISISGSNAFIALGDSGICIIDITEPSAPLEISYLNTPGSAHNVAISGTYAYVADGTALRVVNISIPANPIEIGYCSIWSAWAVAILQPYAFVVGGYGTGGGLVEVSIVAPSAPVVVGNCQTYGPATNIALSWPFAYVSIPYYQGGIQVINISAPWSLIWIGQWLTPEGDGAHDIKICGNLAFVGAGLVGLRVLGVSSPTNPVEVGYYDSPGAAWGVSISGTYAYVADADYFGIYDFSACVSVDSRESPLHPSSFILHPSHPNPFNATTVASYELRAASQVKLRIYDIAGKSVATLVDEWKPAGKHQAIFNGAGLPSGIYLARLQAGAFSQVQKLVLMK